MKRMLGLVVGLYVAAARLAGGHHGVTRSGLDAVRRRADGGASGRRLKGDVCSQLSPNLGENWGFASDACGRYRIRCIQRCVYCCAHGDGHP
jgi:hypothetical protein